MSLYYVNNKAQPNGDHEVHITHCFCFPEDRKCLGVFLNSPEAILEARKIYSQSNGCVQCLPECHTAEFRIKY